MADYHLENLQNHFRDALLGKSSNLMEWIDCSSNLSVEQALAVYRNNRVSVLVRALQTIYPACHRILGRDYFSQLAQAYAHAYPSHNSNLNHYGEHFIEFLRITIKQQQELADFPYLLDLANLEQQCHWAHYAQDDTVFDYKAMAKLDDHQHDKLVLLLSHSLSLLTSSYPVRTIRENNLDAKAEARCVAGLAQQEYLLIHRLPPVVVKVISQHHYAILQSIQKGLCLAELTERFGNLTNLSEWLVQHKYLRGFHI